MASQLQARDVETLVDRWIAAHPGVIVREGGRLIDVGSGEGLPFSAAEITHAELRENSEQGGSYVVLARGDGQQVVLGVPGLAWAPSAENTGPLPFLPPVVCWRDFDRLCAQIGHFLDAHREEGAPQEAAEMVLLGVALLDGARALGFEVSERERHLDALLARLERQRA